MARWTGVHRDRSQLSRASVGFLRVLIAGKGYEARDFWRGTGISYLRAVACTCCLLAVAACAHLQPDGENRRARNVIVMINDGAGWGAWDAAAYWQYGAREGVPYADFPARYGMTTYPLHLEARPTAEAFSPAGYDPARAWDTTPTDDPALPFEGYRYLAVGPTDSAASGTALSSGVKTYLGAINYDNNGQPTTYSTLIARAEGKATGVVTSVPFAHATPAAFGAQNRSRQNYHEIARQMLSEGHLDLIMGTGAPGYNVNGTPCELLAQGESKSGCDHPYEYLAAEDWGRLQAGGYVPHGHHASWRVIRDNVDFVALANGTLAVDGPVLGVPTIAKTLQQQRQGVFLGQDPANPSGIAYVGSVPTLDTMTRGALRHLAARSANGFFLMIEGGATDWAGHTSHCGSQWSYGTCGPEPEYGRLIEETVDFNNAVAAVIEWVEANSNWNETLLIVTTDHDNSMPMGPNAQAIPFQPIVNNGKGRMPGFSFRPTGDHSNALVPLWAKGVGASHFGRRVRGRDEGYARHVGWNDGRYVDSTDVAAVVRAVLEAAELAETPR